MLLFVVSLFPGVGAALTLSAAMEQAAANPDAVARLRAEVARAEGEARVALGELLPRLTVQSGVTRNDVGVDVGGRSVANAWDYSSSAVLSVDLFRGVTIPQRRASLLALDAATAQADWEAATLRRAAGRVYLTALAARANWEAAVQSVTLANETLAQVQVRLDLGFAVPADVSQARLAVLRAEGAVLDALVVLEDLLEELAWLTGQPRVAPTELGEPSLPAAPMSDGSRLSSLLALDAQIDAGNERVRAQRWTLLPTASMQANSVWGQESLRAPEGTYWSVTLNLQWTLFDYARYGRIDVANASVDALVAQRSEAERRNRTDETLAARQLTRATEREVLAEEAVTVAEETVGLVRTRFELGEGTTLELTAAEVEAFRTRTDRNVARLQRSLAWLDLAWQRGALGTMNTPAQLAGPGGV